MHLICELWQIEFRNRTRIGPYAIGASQLPLRRPVRSPELVIRSSPSSQFSVSTPYSPTRPIAGAFVKLLLRASQHRPDLLDINVGRTAGKPFCSVGNLPLSREYPSAECSSPEELNGSSSQENDRFILWIFPFGTVRVASPLHHLLVDRQGSFPQLSVELA